jgi:hypothetical protein
VIRIEEHEACRINFGFTTLPKEMGAYILEQNAEGGGFRQLAFAAPKDRYQTAIWEGLFAGSANQPPATGTYRIHVFAKDDQGIEEVSELIRVENPGGKTVAPRAESEYGEKVSTLRFDGESLTLEDKRGRQITVRAVSGMKAGNPRNPEGNDYTRPACQWAKDRGPIPGGNYVVRKDVAVQEPTLVRRKPNEPEILQYPSGGSASGWGPLRALLSPWEVCGRNEFFIHLDVGDDGTAGCIGVNKRDVGKFNLMMKILKRATQDVAVEVTYPRDTRDCYGFPVRCEEHGKPGDVEEQDMDPEAGAMSSPWVGQNILVDQPVFQAVQTLVGVKYMSHIHFEEIRASEPIAKGVMVGGEGFGYLQISETAHGKGEPLLFTLLRELVRSNKVVTVAVVSQWQRIPYISYEKAKLPKGLAPFRERYAAVPEEKSFAELSVEEAQKKGEKNIGEASPTIGLTLYSRAEIERLYGVSFPIIRTEEASRRFNLPVGSEITVSGSRHESISQIFLMSEIGGLMGASHGTLVHELFGHFYLAAVKGRSSLHVVDEPFTQQWMDTLRAALPRGVW